MGFLGFRWLVNFGLLAVPIAATLGVLIGLQSHRDATGQAPLFTGDDGDDGTGDSGGSSSKNGIEYIRNCDKAYGITPDSKGQEYTLNPNQWGVEDGDTGFLCMNVTAFNNGSYATDTTAPEFFVTWQYPQGPETQPVHAFPNIKVDGSVFPVEISSISSINVDIEWTYGVGNDTASSTDEAALTANTVNTNVAIDMFLDSDKTSAEDSTKAKFEMMVWLAAFGAATQPIGLAAGAVTTQTINGTTFSLYTGQNSLDQYVLTWVASETTEKFHGDLAPLVVKLTTLSGNYPTTSDYLGYMGLGSEALYATNSTTFYVPMLSMDIEKTST